MPDTPTPAPGLRDTLATWLRAHALADLEDETAIDSLTHTVTTATSPTPERRPPVTSPQQPGDLRKQIANAIHNAYGRHSLDRAYRATHQVMPLIQPLLDEVAALRTQLAAIESCGASTPGIGDQPIGPCILRAGHDGPVHQAASGARWWPRDPDPKETDR